MILSKRQRRAARTVLEKKRAEMRDNLERMIADNQECVDMMRCSYSRHELCVEIIRLDCILEVVNAANCAPVVALDVWHAEALLAEVQHTLREGRWKTLWFEWKDDMLSRHVQ